MTRTFSTVWRNRRLAGELARRDFRARYAGSSLGLAWSVLEPAVQFGLYYVVFSYFLGMRFESPTGVDSFGLYLIGGLIPYLALQESVGRAAGLVRANAQLIRHIIVPVEVVLAGGFLAVLMRHAIAYALVLVLAGVTGSLAWAQLPWLVAAVVLLVLGTWGVSLLLVPLGAYLPDVVQVVGTGMMALFFLTPVVYPESLLPPAVARWLVANPLVGLLDAFRAPLIGRPASLTRVAVAFAAVVCVLVIGSLVFARHAASVRDLA